MNRRLGFGLLLATAVAFASAVALHRSGERPSDSESDAPPVATALPVVDTNGPRSGHQLSAINRSETRARSLGNERRVSQRAAALAREFGLSADNEGALREVLLEEQVRRERVFRDLRGASQDQLAEVRARVRGELDAILAWKSAELSTRFGSDLAGALTRR